MTVSGDYRLVDIGNILLQISDLGSVFFRKAVSCCVRNVHHCCTRLYDSFNNPGKVFIFTPSGIFSIEFDIFNEFFRVFDCVDCSFYYLFGCRFYLVLNVERRGPDTCMYPFLFGILKSISCYFYVFLYSPCQSADYRIGDCF